MGYVHSGPIRKPVCFIISALSIDRFPKFIVTLSHVLRRKLAKIESYIFFHT